MSKSENHRFAPRWAWPLLARKAHWFPKDSITSACGSWMFTGEGTRSQGLGKKPGPDDCVRCWRKAKKTQEKR